MPPICSLKDYTNPRESRGLGGKNRRDHRRREEAALRRRFGEAQLQLQSDPQHLPFQDELSAAHQALLEYDLLQAQWMDNLLQQRWLRGGDKCSRIFFSTLNLFSSETEFFEILGIDGIILKDWEEMAEAVI